MKKMESYLLTKGNTILLFCLSVMLGTGCFNPKPGIEHDVRWQGRTLENGTNKVVPFAKIYLYEYSTSDFTNVGPNILIETYESDKDGKFDFTYTDKLEYGYEIKVGAAKYYLSKGIGSKGNKGQSYNDVLLDPYAWIKFHVKNVNPYDENDKIDVNESCFTKLIYGTQVDTTIICDAIGNVNQNLVWWVTKNSNKVKYNDTIPFLKAHDTTYFEIKY